MTLDFITKLNSKQISLYGTDNAFKKSVNPSKFNIEDPFVSSFQIEWGIEIDVREWGIRSISAVIKKWSFDVETEAAQPPWSDDPTNEIPGYSETYNSNSDNFELKYDLDLKDIDTVEIDFNLQTIEIY